jgi:hypothetical protein
MSFLLLFTTLLMGIFQIENLKLKWQKANIKTWVIVTLLAISTCISFVMQKNKDFDDSYSKDAGTIDGGSVSSRIFYIKQGDSRMEVDNGIFNIQQISPLLLSDINLKIWFEGDQIKVTCDVRDSLGNIIASMDRNEWLTNKSFLLDRNFNKNSLEVKDNTGQVVFQVQLKGDEVSLMGIFFKADGRYLVISSFRNPKGTNKGFFAVLGGPYSKFKEIKSMEIEPIFRYPSTLHKGELLVSSQ